MSVYSANPIKSANWGNTRTLCLNRTSLHVSRNAAAERKRNRELGTRENIDKGTKYMKIERKIDRNQGFREETRQTVT